MPLRFVASIIKHPLLAAKGVAIILVSSELPEVLGMSDRVLVMKDDAIVAELTGEQINAVEVMRYAL